MDIEVVRARIREERERQRETLGWYETRRTWSPPALTPQQKQEFDEYSKKFDLPF